MMKNNIAQKCPENFVYYKFDTAIARIYNCIRSKIILYINVTRGVFYENFY